jgi:hypothetical protein
MRPELRRDPAVWAEHSTESPMGSARRNKRGRAAASGKVPACSLMFAYWQHCVVDAAGFLGFEGFLRCSGLILAAGLVARGR